MPVPEQLAPRPLTEPARSRLEAEHPDRDAILQRHAAAMAAGAPAYEDPASGYLVFTARFLAERGTCCTAGCRHCPYVVDAP